MDSRMSEETKMSEVSEAIFSKCGIQCVRNLVCTRMSAVEKFVYMTSMKKTYTLDEVSHHCDSASCWLVLWDKVYDVTEFLHTHPGGEDIILENAGRDATVPFESKGHSKDAYNMLEQYCIGHFDQGGRKEQTLS